ncbi:MAG: hypothetical protein LBR13_02470 [Dysgonamonadaceae bacterium]|jgi:hypothetical protein|nr:hypothetical protein [Dysgonamonadaceae bacterium]
MSIFNFLRKRKATNTITLHSKAELELIPSQIVYVEGEYNYQANKLIKDNLQLIESLFAEKGYDFIYLPKIVKEFSTISYGSYGIDDIIRFVFPSSFDTKNLYRDQRTGAQRRINISTATKSIQLFEKLNYSGTILPGFLRKIHHNSYEYWQLDYSNEKFLLEAIKKYCAIINFATDTIEEYSGAISEDFPPSTISEDDYFVEVEEERIHPPKLARSIRAEPQLGEERAELQLGAECVEPQFEKEQIRYSLANDRAEAEAIEQLRRITEKEKLEKNRAEKDEIQYQTSPYDVINKIRELIYDARLLGIYEGVIREIFEEVMPDYGGELGGLSHIAIDSDYKITLPEYGYCVAMSTLPKALYILFLKHPEGIVLKCLPDYEAELLNIYKTISNRYNTENLEKSIEELCSPASNSANEKLSRIRAAFTKKMSDKFARYYYVSGERGKPNRISLDRMLVSLPAELK